MTGAGIEPANSITEEEAGYTNATIPKTNFLLSLIS